MMIHIHVRDDRYAGEGNEPDDGTIVHITATPQQAKVILKAVIDQLGPPMDEPSGSVPAEEVPPPPSTPSGATGIRDGPTCASGGGASGDTVTDRISHAVAGPGRPAGTPGADPRRLPVDGAAAVWDT